MERPPVIMDWQDKYCDKYQKLSTDLVETKLIYQDCSLHTNKMQFQNL